MSATVFTKEMLTSFSRFLNLSMDQMNSIDYFESDPLAEKVVEGVLTFIKNHQDGIALINKDALSNMVDRVEWLGCLEAAGVDNWEGYDDARDFLEYLEDN